MQCPRCQQENPPQARFCMKCAAGLTLTCAKCHTELPTSAAFCFGCGQPVAGAPAAQRRASPESYTPKHLAEKILTSKAALEGERKQVTVLFADLKGSMELLADRDPEEARKLLDPVLERMMDAVHRYEGTVNQVMGDGIMALFGAPVAHEDHAVRACYAALRMQDDVKRYSLQTRRTQGVDIQIRVGLNSGEVVVRSIGSDLHMDYTAVGQTVHLAARMEQFGTPGSIRVTAGTLRLAEGFVEVRSLGLVPVKGLAEPVEVFELAGPGTARTRLQAAATRGLTHFVGRDAEIEHLRRVLSLAAAGHGQVVAIVGEAGVGKSRLVHEFTHSHRAQDWLILEAASVSFGKATRYLPVIDLLKGYFKIGERDDHREMRDKVLGRVLGLDRTLEPMLPPLLALLDVPTEDRAWQNLDPPQRRQHTLDAIKRLLLRESRVQPLLLVFEDLHWIDSETQALLDSLVESLGSARVLLLVNYRPEYEPRWGSKTFYTQLRLDSLPVESTAELLQALLGPDPGLEPLTRMLAKRGNPFFLEETVRTLVEAGALAGERGAYRLTRPVESLQVPPTVQTILAARIDRLLPEEKQLLQAASVVGKDVPYAILAAIAEQPEAVLQRGLAHLQEAEFLYGTRLFPDLEYTFKHALTHEVTYGSLLGDRRRVLHRRIGELLEESSGDRLPEVFERLALHFYRGEVWDKAVHYDLTVAEKAKTAYAYVAAAQFCRRALELARKFRELADEQRRALVLLGDLQSLLGQPEEANRSYQGALEATTTPEAQRWITNKLHRSRRVVRDGATIVFYEHGGGKETLVIVHPLIYGLATFQPALELLCQEFRIITIDPRGTGASDPVPTGYTIKDHAEDVRAIIDAAGAAPCIGVGISRGGNQLVNLITTHPRLLRQLVTVGTSSAPAALYAPGREWVDEIRDLLNQQKIEAATRILANVIFSEPGTQDLVDQFVSRLLQAPTESVLAFFSPDAGTAISPLLGQVRIPMLVTHGTADRLVPFETGRDLAQRAPGARFYAFEGRGHLPIFTATAEFCEVLRRFIVTGEVLSTGGQR
jgi:class 3 adenylate cyclase/pimeloyl-ACP methyl ester carboxylesterase